MASSSRARRELERLLDEGGSALPGRPLDVDQLRALASTRAVALEAETPAMTKRMNRELFALGVPVLALYQILREQDLDQAEALAALDELLAAAYRVRLRSPLIEIDDLVVAALPGVELAAGAPRCDFRYRRSSAP